MKKLFGGLTLLVLGVFGVTVGLHVLVSQKEIRQRVTEALLAQTGVKLEMGNAVFQFLPWPSFHAQNVVLSRPACAPFAAVRSMRSDISALALLHREVLFQNFTADGVKVAYGTGNAACSWKGASSRTPALPLSAPPLETASLENKTPEKLGSALSDSASHGSTESGPIKAHWRFSFEALRLTDARFQENLLTPEVLAPEEPMLKKTGKQDDHKDAHKNAPQTPVTAASTQTSSKDENVFVVSLLALSALRSQSPWIELTGKRAEMPFSLKGHVGPLEPLFASRKESAARPTPQGPTHQETANNERAGEKASDIQPPNIQAPISPWAFSVDATLGAKDRLTLDGAFTDLALLSGLRLSAQGEWADLRDASLLFPQLALPDVRDIKGVVGLRAETSSTSVSSSEARSFGERLAALPAQLVPSRLRLTIGQAQLAPPFAPTALASQDAPLKLENVQIDAPTSHAPLDVTGQISRNGADGRGYMGQGYNWGVQARFGSLEQVASLVRGAGQSAETPAGQTPLPLDMTLTGKDGAQVKLKGTLDAKSSVFSVEGNAKTFALPDSGVEIHDFKGEGRLSFGSFDTNSLAQGVESFTLDPLSFASREISGKGRVAFQRETESGRTLETTLHLSSVDGTALFLGGAPGTSKQTARKETTPARESARQTEMQGWPRLRAFMKNWRTHGVVRADEVRLAGLTYNEASVEFTSGQDRLAIAPVQAKASGTALSGRLALQAVQPQKEQGDIRFTLVANPMIVPAALFSEGFGWPNLFQGNVRLKGALSGQGDDLAALGASLNGDLGVGIVDGRVSGSLLAPLAGPAASLLKLNDRSLGLRCLASRAVFRDGTAIFKTFVLQAGHFLVTGDGNFTPETGALDLALRPRVKVAGTLFAAPVQVKGNWRAPAVSMLRNGLGDGQGETHQLDIGGPQEDTDPCAAGMEAALGAQGVPALPPMPHADGGGLGGGILRALGLEGGK